MAGNKARRGIKIGMDMIKKEIDLNGVNSIFDPSPNRLKDNELKDIITKKTAGTTEKKKISEKKKGEGSFLPKEKIDNALNAAKQKKAIDNELETKTVVKSKDGSVKDQKKIGPKETHKASSHTEKAITEIAHEKTDELRNFTEENSADHKELAKNLRRDKKTDKIKRIGKKIEATTEEEAIEEVKKSAAPGRIPVIYHKTVIYVDGEENFEGKPHTEQIIKPFIAQLIDSKSGEVFTINKSMTFGADPNSDIVNTDSKYISWEHAVFILKEHSLYVKDISRNGTKVNGIRIEKDRETLLKNGDTIRFADVDYIYKE